MHRRRVLALRRRGVGGASAFSHAEVLEQVAAGLAARPLRVASSARWKASSVRVPLDLATPPSARSIRPRRASRDRRRGTMSLAIIGS